MIKLTDWYLTLQMLPPNINNIKVSRTCCQKIFRVSKTKLLVYKNCEGIWSKMFKLISIKKWSHWIKKSINVEWDKVDFLFQVKAWINDNYWKTLNLKLHGTYFTRNLLSAKGLGPKVLQEGENWNPTILASKQWL